MSAPERPLPNPHEWQDRNDERYHQQQMEISDLRRQVKLLMETVTTLMRVVNSK